MLVCEGVSKVTHKANETLEKGMKKKSLQIKKDQTANGYEGNSFIRFQQTKSFTAKDNF